jgi:hypothetical protein
MRDLAAPEWTPRDRARHNRISRDLASRNRAQPGGHPVAPEKEIRCGRRAPRIRLHEIASLLLNPLALPARATGQQKESLLTVIIGRHIQPHG